MPLNNLWFKHDFNARNNPKLLKLKMKMKMEGVGIYWSLIETLYELNGYLKEDDLETFCFNEHIEIEKVKQVLKLANFQYDKNKGYYANGVLERIKQREEFCVKQKEKADKRWSKVKKKVVEPPEWLEQHDKEREEWLKQQEFEQEKKAKMISLEELKKMMNEEK